MNDQVTIEKDCTSLLTLDVKNFVTAIFRELLEREPDNEGFAYFLSLIYQGAPKEVVIYQIATSPEFAGRYIIKYLDKYEKINKKFVFKSKIKNIPFIGWFIKFSKIPNILTEIQIMRTDSFIRERCLQEKLNIVQTGFVEAIGKMREEQNTKDKELRNLINNNMDWINQCISSLSGKVDTANDNIVWGKNNSIILNESIDWIKKNSASLSEKVDAANDGIKLIKDNTASIFEKVDGIPKTNEIMSKFDGLTYLFNIQSIIDSGLYPTVGFERLHADLIQLLNDKTDEFEAYNQFTIEQIAGYAEGKTVVAAHYSKLISDYASKNDLLEIEAAGIEPVLLPDICKEKDTLIIANPALSALILTSPLLLAEITQKLSRNLVLLVRYVFYPVYVTWEGFSFVEKEERKGIFRWAEDKRNHWCIQFTNVLAKPIEVKLHWYSDSLRGKGKLTASCCGKTINAELNKYVELNMNVTLLPGANNLDFIFSEPAEEVSNLDKRILAFRVVNLSCNINKKNLDQDIIYNKNDLSSDEYIRSTLHQNGFYDVISTAYTNHGISKRELVSTRYKYPSDYRVISKAEKYAIEGDEIICYKACRLRQTDNIII